MTQLLSVLAELNSNVSSVMLVGHNPGLENLIRYFCPNIPAEYDNFKLMPTCALAKIKFQDDWSALQTNIKASKSNGVLDSIVKVRDLMS